MNMEEIFQKKGGLELLKRYWKVVLFYRGSRNTTTRYKQNRMRILQLSADLKICQKVERKYRSLLERFDREIVPAESYGEGKRYQFEDIYLRGPSMYNEYRTWSYGDYMQLPPEDKRKTR